MSKRKLPEYLRSYRKRVGLSQSEMAYLLGLNSATSVSRFERREQLPDLRRAFAYQVILSVSVESLFAGVFEEVKRETERRAMVMARRLLKKPKPTSPHERALL